MNKFKPKYGGSLLTTKELMVIIKWRFRNVPHDDKSKEYCPNFFQCTSDTDYITCMLELIEYKKIIAKSRDNHNPLHLIINDLYYFINGNILLHVDSRNISYHCVEVEELFYREHPEHFQNPVNKFAAIETKLKSIEQFQAQILDKLSVFAEMLDDIQNKHIKLKE